jgi:uncharacterized membrane protein YbhN (UPF0104 family)
LPKLSKLVFWSVLLVATVAAALWAIGYFAGGYRRLFQLAAPITPARWAVLAGAAAVFYLLDYARLYTLFRLLGVRIAPAMGLQLTCVSYFVANLTPTAELTIPAMILLLRGKGIPASQTTAVALVKTFYITAWVCVAGFGGLLFSDEVRLPAPLAEHVVLLSAPAALLITGFFYVMFFPGRVLRWKARNRLADGIRHCAAALSQIGHSAHPLHWLAHASCLAFIGAYVFIGACVCDALDLPLSAGKAAAAFNASLLVSYLAPVPGAMGVTEVLTAYFIDPAMGERSMVAATLLRFFCWYVLALPGALVLLNAIRAVGWRELARRWRLQPQR